MAGWRQSGEISEAGRGKAKYPGRVFDGHRRLRESGGVAGGGARGAESVEVQVVLQFPVGYRGAEGIPLLLLADQVLFENVVAQGCSGNGTLF